MTPYFAIVRMQQPAAKLAKDFYVQLGWRPTIIIALGADSNASVNYFVDGLTGEDDTVLMPTGGGALDHNATPGIKVDATGFTIGQESTFFDRNDALVGFLVWGQPPTNEVLSQVITVSNDLPLRDDEAFGEASQYDADIETDGSGRYNPEFSDPGVYRES